MKTVLFLHGLESQPGGTKARYLERLGYSVFNPALPRDSFEDSVCIAQSVVDEEQPDCVIGSSRGGAVAMGLERCSGALVLVAPAWRRYFNQIPTNLIRPTVVLHSPNDCIIPYEDSVVLANVNRSELITVGSCHRMSDDEALTAIGEAVHRLAINLEHK